jgi:NAD+ synthetase
MRGTLLMAFANKHGHLVLTTGNKSECAVGYCTIYGDTNGALAPIADLWKTEVWSLSRWLNRDGARIPVRSIDKPPSAELRPGQYDTDSLPPYPVLDPVLRCLIEDDLSVAETAARTGMPRARRGAVRQGAGVRMEALPVPADAARQRALLERPAHARRAPLPRELIVASSPLPCRAAALATSPPRAR